MMLTLGAAAYTGAEMQQDTSSSRLRTATMPCDAGRALSTTTAIIGFAIDSCDSFGIGLSLMSLQSLR